MTERPDTQLRRLAELLDAYGARESNWPAADRQWMRAVIETDTDARELFNQAAALDTLLDTVRAPYPSLELEAAILEAAAPDANRRRRVALWPFGPVWQPATALGAALVLGLYVGGAQLIPRGGQELSELADLTESIEIPAVPPENER